MVRQVILRLLLLAAIVRLRNVPKVQLLWLQVVLFLTIFVSIDNEATYKVGDQYPTWQEAKDFCEAAGKFLLTYEQHKLGAQSTNSEVVRDSGGWEWVLKSNGDDSRGQASGFFFGDGGRFHDGGFRVHYLPVFRYYGVAFRCGRSPSPQASGP